MIREYYIKLVMSNRKIGNEKCSQKREYLNNNLLGTRQVLLQGEDIRQLLESL